MSFLNAAQVYSAAPYLANGGQPYLFKIATYELVTAILGVTRFKKNHPGATVTLYTDNLVKDYLNTIGLLSLWDNVNTVVLEDEMSKHNIDHKVFWAASKVFAYRDAPIGTIFFDLDFILWQSLEGVKDGGSGLPLSKADLVASHFDYVEPEFGTGGSYDLPDNYTFPSYIRSPKSGKFLGVNASFLQINSQELKDKYTEEAIKFMVDNKAEPKSDLFPHAYMCLCEQNFLLDIALELDKTIAYLAPYHEFKNYPKQITTFYHIGDTKNKLRLPESTEAENFYKSALIRLENEAPHFSSIIKSLLP